MADAATSSGQVTPQPGAASDKPAEGGTLLTGVDGAAAPKVEAKAPTDAKPDDKAEAKPDEGKDSDKDAKATVPEKYEFKFAEGVEVDAAALEAFTPILKDLGLSQEQAQKLADSYAAQMDKVRDSMIEQHVNQVQEWAKSVREDKEIGGANFDANVKIAQRAIARFGDAELKQVLDQYGVGNHPAVVRAFLKVGREIKEDNLETGGAAGGGARKPTEEVFYGKQS
jgi:hypothetical protein